MTRGEAYKGCVCFILPHLHPLHSTNGSGHHVCFIPTLSSPPIALETMYTHCKCTIPSSWHLIMCDVILNRPCSYNIAIQGLFRMTSHMIMQLYRAGCIVRMVMIRKLTCSCGYVFRCSKSRFSDRSNKEP